jgi:PAS domain S-box-containing protein
LIAGVTVFFGLCAVSFRNYLLFHSAAEIFSIVIGCGIFMVAWNARSLLDNHYFLLLGIASLSISVLDVFHTLAYQGMGVFTGYGPDLATQLWVAARAMQALSLLIAPLFIHRRLRVEAAVGAYGAAVVLALLLIFFWQVFPRSFVEGVGLTPFKKWSEYVISAILVLSAVALIRRRRAFDGTVLRMLIASILITAVSELSFTLYADTAGLFIGLGHLLKIVSSYLLYTAIIRTGLVNPYALLSKSLTESREALRESEERYRHLAENINEVLYQADRRGIVTYISPVIEDLSGFKPEEIQGRELLGFLHEEDAPSATKQFERVLSGAHVTDEIRIRHKTRGHCWVRASGRPKTAGDAVVGVQGILADVTDYKHWESQLIRAKNEWQLTFDAVPDLIMILDKDRRIVRVNKAMEERLGKTSEAMAGLPCFELFHETGQPPHSCPHALCMQDGLEHVIELFEPLLKGYYLVTVSPLKDAEGSLMGAVHVARDITKRRQAEEALQRGRDELERRVEERTAQIQQMVEELRGEIAERIEAEAALRESESKYSALVEGSLIGVYIEQEGAIRFANDRFAEIHGYTKQEMMGMDSLLMIHPEDRARVLEIRRMRYQGGDAPTEYEARGVTKDGRTIWALRRNRLMQYGGRPAVLGNVVDITERKEMERAIRDSERDLHLLSARLLSAEENERKRIAQELHDGIGQSLSALKFGVENVLHQLRGGAKADAERYLSTFIPFIQNTIEEVRAIVMDLRPSILDDLGILPTIHWFCREFQYIHPRIRMTEEISLEEGDIPEALKTPIYRILQEGLNNVSTHSGADAVRVALGKRDGRIVLEIQDNGQGFDPKAVASAGASRRGFGLSSMRERAEAAGGTFVVESLPGGGTRLLVSWPEKTD